MYKYIIYGIFDQIQIQQLMGLYTVSCDSDLDWEVMNLSICNQHTNSVVIYKNKVLIHWESWILNTEHLLSYSTLIPIMYFV